MISLYIATHLTFLSLRLNLIPSNQILCSMRSVKNFLYEIRSTDFFDSLTQQILSIISDLYLYYISI